MALATRHSQRASLQAQAAGHRGAAESTRRGSGGALPETPEQKYRLIYLSAGWSLMLPPGWRALVVRVPYERHMVLAHILCHGKGPCAHRALTKVLTALLHRLWRDQTQAPGGHMGQKGHVGFFELHLDRIGIDPPGTTVTSQSI